MSQRETLARRLGRWLFAGLLFATPLSTSAVEIFASLLLGAWWVGWVLQPQTPTLWRSRPARSLVLVLGVYLAACLLSTVFSTDVGLSFRGFFRKTAEYALLFLAASDLIQDSRTLRLSLRAWLAASFLVVLYGLLQEWAIVTALHSVQAVDPFLGKRVEFVRMVGPYKNPNDLAAYLMVMTLVLLPHLMRLAGRAWISLGILLAVMFGCLIRTQSMGGLLGFGIGFMILWVFEMKRTIRWGGLALAFAAVGGVFIATTPEHLGMLTFTDLASSQRLEMWRVAWRMILDRPWVGHGLNTFMANFSAYAPADLSGPAYAHNVLLQTAAETGWIGLGTFLGFLALWARSLWLALRRTDPGQPARERLALLGLTAGGAAFLVQSVFDTNFYALRQAVLFWTLAGCAFGISRRRAAST
ncbi:MAG: O-antigen ligase family protein [Candidatus Omnitrophica bacterium]|nr:O-antigen ligase family protein [Candidatus Omnitrophota bacterium]